MKEYLKIKAQPLACPDNVILGNRWRISVLTESLVRVEYDADGCFTDSPTQTVLNRSFPKTDFIFRDNGDTLEISTAFLRLNYDKREFSAKGLSCHCLGMSGENRLPWRYGERSDNLKGTARTLDEVNGSCELGEGILSEWTGCAALDDSHTLTLTPEGWVCPRKKGIQDIYIFAYGHRYKEALRDFYFLCGKTPMLPRFALGNWWSRYHAYTEESYLELMRRFDEENVPFSVAVIDMDWHLVDIDPKYGTGWTGFTWNKDLFPDHKRFLQTLHKRGMKTTLNLHPADGIRGYEKCYPDVAKAMGVDAAGEEPVNFDIADEKFLEVYFEKALHPLEDEGVDFWWVDWQQGTKTKIEGLDPLWMLNHYHFLDSARDGMRPMTFSRYAGPGSHRYPVGFSGDTVITWESLDFQPYFTNTASNIGYGWWSHDIGGHMQGYKNDELETRWYQYGVFSPIMRLHSTCNQFNGKEPWRFKKEARDAMDEFLRLRHRLVPYLYTMNHRAWLEDEPLCQPMYYIYPERREAYGCKNQYFFGSELMVAPITSPGVRELNAAKTEVWLPDGLWFDFFTGTVYKGGRRLNMYRSLDSIPVLAKAGAILPMTEKISAADAATNPDELTIRIYPGADNRFMLYEDDCKTCAYLEGDCALTSMETDWTNKRFTIYPVKGNTELIPQRRLWRLEFYNITAKNARVLINGEALQLNANIEKVMPEGGSILTVTLPEITPSDKIEIILPKDADISANPVKELLYSFLNQAEISFDLKDKIYNLACRELENPIALISELQIMNVSEELQQIIMEFIGAF